jgi:hypothetical protein
VATLGRVADPVLSTLAQGTLRAKMPIEQAEGADRRGVTHLEAFGRLIAGMAPWLELSSVSGAEAQAQSRYRALTQQALANAVDPASPDALNFTRESQPLVDSAFLAQGLLRAPHALTGALDQTTKGRLIEALTSTRAITPGFSNWLMFSATVEAGLKLLGAPWDRLRVDYALRQHDQWYRGDGTYGDGPSFHWDYYNSFVIQPMLLDVLDACRDEVTAWKELAVRIEQRARRYAAVQERLIGPDGSFPPIGRSLAPVRRVHLLARMALAHTSRRAVSPGRSACVDGDYPSITEAPGTFDGDGWLTSVLRSPTGVGETRPTGSLSYCRRFLPLACWRVVRGRRRTAFPGHRPALVRQPFPIDHAL